ncbi:MAG: hypothetical protein JXB50_14150, partial [Spirochaetes bacterium]|nr:hypothetical protein [Spirochaetota bacterium]
NFLLNQKDFVNKNQRELLNMAKNEINNRLKNLIKSAVSKLDLDAIYKNYFGNNELNRRNMLNLCGNIKQISDIIRKDTVLFNKISFDREKLEKIFNDKYKKYK